MCVGLKMFVRIKLHYIIRLVEIDIINKQLPSTRGFSEFEIIPSGSKCGKFMLYLMEKICLTSHAIF